MLTHGHLWPADEGCYAGGTFIFDFRVPESYPADPPRVRALTQVGAPSLLKACTSKGVYGPCVVSSRSRAVPQPGCGAGRSLGARWEGCRHRPLGAARSGRACTCAPGTAAAAPSRAGTANALARLQPSPGPPKHAPTPRRRRRPLLPRQVFHPAIDTEGHVDMSLLGADWRPDMCANGTAPSAGAGAGAACRSCS